MRQTWKEKYEWKTKSRIEEVEGVLREWRRRTKQETKNAWTRDTRLELEMEGNLRWEELGLMIAGIEQRKGGKKLSLGIAHLFIIWEISGVNDGCWGMKLRRWHKREGQRGVCIPRQWHICIVIHVRAYLRVHFSPPILQSVQFTSRVSVSFSGFECLPFSVPVHPLFSLCPMPPSALLSLSILPLFSFFCLSYCRDPSDPLLQLPVLSPWSILHSIVCFSRLPLCGCPSIYVQLCFEFDSAIPRPPPATLYIFHMSRLFSHFSRKKR